MMAVMPTRTFLLLLLAAFGGIGCTRGIEESSAALESPRTSATATPAPAVTTSGSAVGKPPIIVRTPLEGDEVVSPLVVRGTAEVEGGHLYVQIIGADGTELAAIAATTSCTAGCRGGFRTTLAFFIPERQGGSVVVSGSTGDASGVSVQVPLTLVP